MAAMAVASSPKSREKGDKTANSWSYFLFQCLILTVIGPTVFPLGASLVVILYWILPFNVYSALLVLYVCDCIFSGAHISGSRTSSWLRRWKGWKAIPDWFDMETHFDINYLEDNDENDMHKDFFSPDRTYIFAIHPHGLFAWGNVICYCNNLGIRNPLLEDFPFLDICMGVATVVLQVPIMRELCLGLGCREVSRPTMTRALREGHSIALNVCGEAGALVAKPGFDNAVLENRMGFVRLALSTGSPLVPVYVFGLVDSYETSPSWLRPIQRFFHKKLRWALPVFYSENFLWLPDQNKLDIVIGKPIDVPRPSEWGAKPDPQAVRELHAACTEALKHLFDKHKGRFGFKDRTLKIVDAKKPY